jgi:hypothetical protein
MTHIRPSSRRHHPFLHHPPHTPRPTHPSSLVYTPNPHPTHPHPHDVRTHTSSAPPRRRRSSEQRRRRGAPATAAARRSYSLQAWASAWAWQLRSSTRRPPCFCCGFVVCGACCCWGVGGGARWWKGEPIIITTASTNAIGITHTHTQSIEASQEGTIRCISSHERSCLCCCCCCCCCCGCFACVHTRGLLMKKKEASVASTIIPAAKLGRSSLSIRSEPAAPSLSCLSPPLFVHLTHP